MTRRTHTFRARDKSLSMAGITRIMGVVNLTPDSFSEGGGPEDPAAAADLCLAMVEAGADLLDLGGESTRPGARPVPEEEELRRVLPVLKRVRGRVTVPLSVDTYKASVARAALEEGADIINDVSAFRFDPGMRRVAREWKAGVILMHMRGNPRVMQELPPSADILREIREELGLAVSEAVKEGISRDHIVIDPGIGFGKTLEQNYRIINNLSFLEELELPVLVGPSRKSFLGGILGRPPGERIWGTAASVATSILRGANMVRVHDVEEMAQVARVADAVLAEGYPV